MSIIDKQAIDFSLPLETENGEQVKYVCHDVVEYKCARVCVDVETGIVYSSPYVGLKIRNTPLRKIIENAATAYADFENGFISDTACVDRSHEYLVFVKEPKNVMALLDELEAKEEQRANWFQMAQKLGDDLDAAERRIAELEARTVNLPKRSVGEVMHMSGFSRDYAEGWCSGNDNAIHEIHAAGLKVAAAGKGE
ncbi:ead/Ea22-like family protein [Enterobacter kobei]|uniref:ead/Ea22-like family protein n=1 Tax=Enterobacter kobei TaxID=208224 RepID=UPI00334C2EE3